METSRLRGSWTIACCDAGGGLGRGWLGIPWPGIRGLGERGLRLRWLGWRWLGTEGLVGRQEIRYGGGGLLGGVPDGSGSCGARVALEFRPDPRGLPGLGGWYERGVGLSGLCGRGLRQRGLGQRGLGGRGLGLRGLGHWCPCRWGPGRWRLGGHRAVQANVGCGRLGLAEQLAPIDGRTYAQR
jgi:hypothetical protein